MKRRQLIMLICTSLTGLGAVGALTKFSRSRFTLSAELAGLRIDQKINIASAALVGKLVQDNLNRKMTFEELYRELSSQGVPFQDHQALLDRIRRDFAPPQRIVAVDGWDVSELEAKLCLLVYLGLETG